jgi:hypothetical protein
MTEYVVEQYEDVSVTDLDEYVPDQRWQRQAFTEAFDLLVERASTYYVDIRFDPSAFPRSIRLYSNGKSGLFQLYKIEFKKERVDLAT